MIDVRSFRKSSKLIRAELQLLGGSPVSEVNILLEVIQVVAPSEYKLSTEEPKYCNLVSNVSTPKALLRSIQDNSRSSAHPLAVDNLEAVRLDPV